MKKEMSVFLNDDLMEEYKPPTPKKELMKMAPQRPRQLYQSKLSTREDDIASSMPRPSSFATV